MRQSPCISVSYTPQQDMFLFRQAADTLNSEVLRIMSVIPKTALYGPQDRMCAHMHTRMCIRVNVGC